MDYGRMGAPKLGKNKPRHPQENGKGAPKVQSGKDTKAALLQRMKAAAKKSK